MSALTQKGGSSSMACCVQYSTTQHSSHDPKVILTSVQGHIRDCATVSPIIVFN
jgi:hypothetical protein